VRVILVRVLIDYDSPATNTWSVTGGSYTAPSHNQEFFSITAAIHQDGTSTTANVSGPGRLFVKVHTDVFRYCRIFGEIYSADGPRPANRLPLAITNEQLAMNYRHFSRQPIRLNNKQHGRARSRNQQQQNCQNLFLN
jgi:hypothetical protein